MFQITTAIKKIAKLQKRIRAIPGGTSAAKTMGILAIMTDMAQRDETPTLSSVVSESFPHLKKGAIKDFLQILEQQKYFNRDRWNKTDYTYTFESGSKIEFFSVDQPGKVRGPRRERLFGNEINNWQNGLEIFNQLEVRTKEVIWMDWNPSSEFWYYSEVKPKRDDIDEITLTYLDNEGLDPAIIRSIEQRKGNRNWWQVYGLGQLGEIEGKIYKNWRIIDEIPHEARLERTGLDFGYTNDPSAIVDVYKYNNGYILDEVAYEKGLLNAPIANLLKLKDPKALVIADSAEPKSIDELKAFGISVLPATKGQGSVSRGIAFVQDQRISITKRSVNGIKEYRNYIWLVDKDGKVLNEEDPRCANHFLSAARYALDSLKPGDTDLHIKQERRWQLNEVNRV